MADISHELRKELADLGFEAAQRYAQGLDAVNAVEFSGEALATRLARNHTAGRFHRGVSEVQQRTKMPLAPLLAVPEGQRDAAVAAFISGLYRFSQNGNRVA